MPMLISLAMIVKNEEATLAHCLESVKTLVDEIIIVDTGSTDKTIDIASSFGAQIHHFEWRDDFSAARNESLKHCKADWVLILDADEAIDASDHEKIKNACLRPKADAYNLITRTYTPTSLECSLDAGVGPNVSNYQEGRHLPFYADNTGLRLAKMFDGLAFQGKIHETIGLSLISNGKTAEALDVVIHHYGKLFVEREGHKTNYYLMLAKHEFDSNPGDERAQFNLLQQALVASQWELAAKVAMTCLEGNPSPTPFVFYGAGLALQELGRHIEAIDYLDRLLRQNPKHSLAMLAKGRSYKAMGNFSQGREFIIKAIESQPNYIPSITALAELELTAKNFDAARKIILDAIAIVPNEPALYDFLLKIEMARDNPEQAAQDALLGLKKCPTGGEGRWHRLAAIYFSQSNQRDMALSILNQGLKIFPGDADLIRLRGMI